jgi:hypothetical protein
MTASRTAAISARLLCMAAGVAIAVALLLGARPSNAVPELPARLSCSVKPSGEFEVKPAAPEPLFASKALRPGGARIATGFEIRNQTGSTLLAGFRAHPSSTALDGLVRIRISVGREQLADTTLQGLRPGTQGMLHLASGESRQVHVEVWIQRATTVGYQGVRERLSLVPVYTRSGG